MRKLNQLFGIGPEFSARLERIGIRTTIELAKANNLEQVSARSGVPLTELREWHQMAQLEVRTSLYRRKVVATLATITVVLLSFLAFWSFREISYLTTDYYAQAVALYEEGNDAEATRMLDEAFARGENTADLHNLRGIVYRGTSQPGRAIAEYKEALKLDPGYASAWNNLGNAYVDLKEHDKAIEQYKKAIELNPQVEAYRQNLKAAERLRKGTPERD